MSFRNTEQGEYHREVALGCLYDESSSGGLCGVQARLPSSLIGERLQKGRHRVKQDASPQELLDRARTGDREALGELIGAHRNLLNQIARGQIDGRINPRLSASDVVQQTCLSAIRHFDNFEGQTEPQFVAWLKRVHQRNVTDVMRQHVVAKKRAVSAQHPLQDELAHSAEGNSASRQAVLKESVAQLMEALQDLPPAQASAVRLRFLEQLPLRDIATEMGRSEVAVAALLKRGLAGLRHVISRDSAES